MPYENIEYARRIDFDKLDMLVSERIAALKTYVVNIDKARDDIAIHDSICRDMVVPCIHLLANFINSVTVQIDVQADA